MIEKFRQYGFITLLLSLTVVLGVNYVFRPFESTPELIVKEEKIEFIKEEKTILTKEDILLDLTPEERVAQLISFPFLIDEEQDGNIITRYRDYVGEGSVSPGFITIFGSEITSQNAKNEINEIKKIYKDDFIPLKVIVDHEGGSVQRLSGEGYTKLPSWNEVCQLDSEERDLILRTSANELKETGINIVLAPVLDVGESKALGDRICSDSYPVVADRSADFTAAFRSHGILPVVKHFPGIGSSSKDLHYNFDSVEVGVNDVKLYKYIIDQSSLIGTMVTHIGVENQDPLIPCSLSASCVGELSTAYPKMLIFSDALDMNSASFNKENLNKPKGLSQVAIEAVRAGNDVLIYGEGVSEKELNGIITNLTNEYIEDEEFKSLVDNAVIKIIEYKYTR